MPRPSALVWFVLLLLCGGKAGALEVRETIWGFGGQIVPGRINLVSVRVANPAERSFDGVLKLRETSGVGGGSGAPYIQPVFLSPRTERWVQFTVFAAMGYEQFALEWDRGSAQLGQPGMAAPARVILTDPAGAFASSSHVRAFSDVLFPTTVAAMDGLDALALDYVPRWEPSRREALVDWIRRGGQLLLLPGADGRHPQFTDQQLAVLNIAGESARIGAGRVVRVATPRRDLTAKVFADVCGPAPEIKPPTGPIVYNPDGSIFQRLAILTRPQIRWGVINWLSLLYVVLIGPVHFLWGRRVDYRLSIGAFVGCVAIFGGLFSVVGRRGSGEAQVVHSLSIAWPLEPGRYDVAQWLSAFATRGAEYSLTHRAQANLYGTVSSEAIRGAFANGKDGRYLADIPLFSSRQFIHRAAMAGDDTSVTVERWEENGDKLKALVLKTAAGFPAEIVEARVRFRDRFYLLQRNGPEFILAESGQAEPFQTALPLAKVQALSFSGPGVVSSDPQDKLQSLLPLLYVRALDGREYFQNALTRGPQPADRLQLFVFARSPEGFRLQGEGFANELGYTLYVQEVFKP